MSREIRPAHVTRSEHWLRVLVNQQPDLLAMRVSAAFGWAPSEAINWLSPLQSDEYAEYRDDYFLNRLGVHARTVALTSFWPRKGPRWDGLGKTVSGWPLLIEAKAYVEEANTSPSTAGPKSLAQIRRSLNQLKAFLRSPSPHDWSALFYQYTNRLAHLYFLRELNNIPASLIFVYFVDAPDVPQPTSESEWRGANRLLKSSLGLGSRHRLVPYIAEVFVDVRELATA